jgi:Ca2+-binding EF-hand superfamily protein
MKTILLYAVCIGAVASSAVAEGEIRPEIRKPRDENRAEKGGDPRNRERKPEISPFGGHGEMFKRMDTNKDGLISKREFFSSPRLASLPEDKRDEMFARLDTDNDGSISKKEIQTLRENGDKRAREFRELDLNRSGGLDFAEFSEGKFFKRLPEEKRRELFNRLDTDNNGEISPKDGGGPRPVPGSGRRGDRRDAEPE